MPAQWSFTLADYPDLVRPLLVKPGSDPTRSTALVFAPCCGRRTPADTIVDVRAIPDTVVRGGGTGEPKDHGWLCDGCLDRLYRDPKNDWTLSKMLEARGAPAVLVNEHKAREWMAQAEREHHKRDVVRTFESGFRPDDTYGQLKEQIEILHRRAAETEAALSLENV